MGSVLQTKNSKTQKKGLMPLKKLWTPCNIFKNKKNKTKQKTKKSDVTTEQTSKYGMC